MNPRCPACGLVFEKEAGYFLGAMVASYLIGAFSLVPLLVGGLFLLRWELPWVLGIGIAQILILHPILFRYSRLAWIFAESKMTGSSNS